MRDAPTLEAGYEAVAETIAQFQREYPAAMECFADGLDASLMHLRLPPAHRKFARTTNLIGRSFAKQRRRT